MERIAAHHRTFLFRFANRRLISAAIVQLQFIGFTIAQPNYSMPPLESAFESADRALEKSLRNDAALADVFFLNGASGWAIGDRGVISHTADGGATWREQDSGVSC